MSLKELSLCLSTDICFGISSTDFDRLGSVLPSNCGPLLSEVGPRLSEEQERGAMTFLLTGVLEEPGVSLDTKTLSSSLSSSMSFFAKVGSPSVNVESDVLTL